MASFLMPGLGQGLAGRPLRGLVVAALAGGYAWLVFQSILYLPAAKSSLAALLVASCAPGLAAAWDAGWLRPGAKRKGSAVAAFLVALLGVSYAVSSLLTAALGRGYSSARSYYIPSESSLPTLQVGDYILVDCRKGTPVRGEILVFHPPAESYTGNKTDLVKRVVAVGGDRVEIRDGALYLNGKALQEPYLKEPMVGEFPEHTVAQGCFFTLGDNRNNSHDSRYFGDVPDDNRVASVRWIFWSQDWNRVGTAVR